MADYAIDVAPPCARRRRSWPAGRTPMYVAIDGALAGLIAVADPIKETSRARSAGCTGWGSTW
jgi:P-type Cu+ transporter